MNLTRQPIYVKTGKQTKQPRKQMRRVAKGSVSSSECPIMASAKNEPCLADWCDCGGSSETTALRHVRKFKIGAMGMKPPNFIGFYGCQRSEDLFATRSQEHWTWRGVCQAMVLTQMKLVKKGLL